MTKSAYLGLTATVPPVVPYLAPAPPVDTGLHRYIFLLFMQPGDNVDLGSFSAVNRRNFDVQSFAKNNTFGPPLAGAYFQFQNAKNSGNSTVDSFFIVDDNDQLVIDTNTPTPHVRKTSDPYPTMARSGSNYVGTLTYSLPASITGEVDGSLVTDSIDLSGQIGDWTMTAPAEVSEQMTTTEVPATRLEIVTSTLSDSSSTSVVRVERVGTESPSASASASTRLDGPIIETTDNSAVGKPGGVTMLMGVLVGGTVYLTSIL